MTYLYVALGGAAGALARFAIGGWITRGVTTAFPWGTLAVNVAGSLLLGLLLRSLPPEGEMGRALLAVGFCGAFTTFSAFSAETVALWQRGAAGTAALYVLASVVFGVLAVLLGFSLARFVAWS